MQSTHKTWVIASALGAVTSLSMISAAGAQTRQETQTSDTQRSEQRQRQRQHSPQPGAQAQQRAGQSQGTETLADHQRELTTELKAVSDHAKFLQDEAKKPDAFSKSVAMGHSDEIGRALDKTQSHYRAWRDASKDNPKMQARFERMDRFSEEARTHHKELQRELDKEMPDPQTVASHAKQLQTSVGNLLDEIKEARG